MNGTSAYHATTTIPDPVWDAFVASDPAGNFLQTIAWGEVKSRWGWWARRVAVRREGILAAGAQLLFRKAPLGRVIAYSPRGPIVTDEDPALLSTLLAEIHRLCRAERALLLTVEPGWPLPTPGVSRLHALGFRPAAASAQPSATILLDLRSDEEAILGQMHPKWRYNIRLAARKEVVVRVGGESDLGTFARLTALTGERDGFATRPPGYYEDVWRLFGPAARLFLAEYAGQPLGAILVVRVGKTATYLYGASSNEERNRMPNHALQWAAIQWARGEGCHTYDFWGIPPEVPESGEVTEFGEGGLWGVFRFKQGFGGRIVKYPGTLDYPYSRLGYFAYQYYQARRHDQQG